MTNELEQKVYWNMTDAEKMAESEEMFQDLKVRYEEFEAVGKLYYSKIDTILKNKDSFEKLTKMIRSEECRHACVVENSFSDLIFWYRIAEREYASGLNLTLYHTNSIHEADLVLQQLHFYLRRIEFEWDISACEEILDFIKEHHISYVCLAEAICKTKYTRPVHISTELAGMMERAGMRMEALKLLYLVEVYLKEEKGKA